MSEDCLFCKIARKETTFTETNSDDEFYAFRDIQPTVP